MDTSKLVVGQVVYMVSGGVYCRSGRVIRIGVDGIDVDMRFEARIEIWRFDINGKACDSRSVGYVPEPYEFDGVPSTYEGGPWELYSEEDKINKERERKRKGQEHGELLKAQKKFSKSLGSSLGLIRLNI